MFATYVACVKADGGFVANFQRFSEIFRSFGKWIHTFLLAFSFALFPFYDEFGQDLSRNLGAY